MTYFGFLLRFLVIPLGMLLLVSEIDRRRKDSSPGFFGGRATGLAVGIHVLLAVAYTTPWDNYLVATGVWYYNPRLISGVLLGWVPLEEYTFFVLETILTGLWWALLARRWTSPGLFAPSRPIRAGAVIFLGAVWLWAVAALAAGWKPVTYLALILAWALPAVMLQLAFGADILWHHRRLVTLAVLPVFLYIAAADALAIASGTWTIDPAQSTGIFIGLLPVEEAVFFLITVVLIAFGMTLALSRLSQERWSAWRKRARRTAARAQGG